MRHFYENGLVAIDRAFGPNDLVDEIRDILYDSNHGHYSELMETERFLKRIRATCEDSIALYDSGRDSMGLVMSKGTEMWRGERLHFVNKMKRIDMAIGVFNEHSPFKENDNG